MRRQLYILGRNGDGKSTLLKIPFGFLPCPEGRISFQGRDISTLAPASRRQIGMSYCPQERIVFEDLSVGENLTIMRPERNMDGLRPYFDRFPILQERLSQHAGTLSGGERKLLAFVRTLAEEQLFILLDEPTEGFQLEYVEHMRLLIEQGKLGGTSFVIVEQNLTFAESIADNYLVMDHGQTILAGAGGDITREDLMKHLRV